MEIGWLPRARRALEGMTFNLPSLISCLAPGLPGSRYPWKPSNLPRCLIFQPAYVARVRVKSSLWPAARDNAVENRRALGAFRLPANLTGYSCEGRMNFRNGP